MTLRFYFPDLKALCIDKWLFTDLKPTFRGNVSFNYVNLSLFILIARNSVFDLKMARPENIFKNVTKTTIITHSRGNSLRGLTLRFYVRFN